MSEAQIRPLRAEDAPAAADIIRLGFAQAERERGEEPEEPPAHVVSRTISRIERFTRTDGPGCWAAEVDGALAGFAVAIRREDLWGLALLFVHPDRQSGRIGTRLLERTRQTADGARVEIIQSSDDPRAIRRYGLLGLRLHPAVGAEGTPERSAIPDDLGVRDGDEADLDLVEQLDRRLRGAPRTDDVAAILREDGGHLVVADRDGRRGYAVALSGGVSVLAADDEATATALLWECLGRGDGEIQQWGFTAAQWWAVDVLLAARMKIKPGGHFFLRGMPALPGPYLASGVYF
jgi:GNAT superfamily N-acetyltransferase